MEFHEKIIISIEGNIGVGKSSFVDILGSVIPDSETVGEPVELWKSLKDKDDKNILQKFYGDMSRWSYTFQNLACISRMTKIEDVLKSSKSKYIFLDRSLGTDKNVFEKMLYDDGYITEIEHSMYNMWCDFYSKYVQKDYLNIIIYMKASSHTVLNRIRKRGRIEESEISVEYLEKLNVYHDKWLTGTNKPPNIIEVDCNIDFIENIDYQKSMINYIMNNIETISEEYFKKKSHTVFDHNDTLKEHETFETNYIDDVKDIHYLMQM